MSGFGHVGVKDKINKTVLVLVLLLVDGLGPREDAWFGKRKHMQRQPCKGAICMGFEFQSR